jgi:uncharacterized protein
MKNYLCLSASDIHGNKIQYEKIKKIVIKQKVSFVFFCGDLLPKTGGLWYPENKIRTIKLQKDFIQSYLIDYLKDLSKYAYVYAIFGNDDFKSNYNLVQGINEKVFFLDTQTIKLPTLEDIYVTGYPYVSLTPFLQKDWEKWDTKAPLTHKTYKLEGYTSKNGVHLPINFANRADGRSTIMEDLQTLAKQSDPKKTVYVFHEAPYDTPLDMVAKDNKYIEGGLVHVGSRAIREFIEKEQPLLTMHGHIHETFRESGEYEWKYKKSKAVSAANDFSQDIVAYILFNLPKITSIERHLA